MTERGVHRDWDIHYLQAEPDYGDGWYGQNLDPGTEPILTKAAADRCDARTDQRGATLAAGTRT